MTKTKPKINNGFIPEKYSALGAQVKISPKSNVTINKPGGSVSFDMASVSVRVDVGKSHTAYLVMSKSCWEALRSGEGASVQTNKDFVQNVLI